MCSSASPATGVLMPTSRAGTGEVTRMKAPLDFWAGTVARTQASDTVTWAKALAAAAQPSSTAAAIEVSFMIDNDSGE